MVDVASCMKLVIQMNALNSKQKSGKDIFGVDVWKVVGGLHRCSEARTFREHQSF